MKRDAGREVVFELRLDDPNELIGWQTFGGARVATLYPPEVETAQATQAPGGAH